VTTNARGVRFRRDRRVALQRPAARLRRTTVPPTDSERDAEPVMSENSACATTRLGGSH
jgi:hypothetical protein